MNDLIERLEKATGRDLSLDYQIELYVRDGKPLPRDSQNWPIGVKDYTSSIDAALTLVPKGLNYVLKARNPGAKSEARVGGPQGGFIIKDGEHSSPAIALCIAALKARAAMAEQQPVN
jgi:hypothetical protein